MDQPQQQRSFLKTFLIVAAIVAVTAFATAQLTTAYLFPKSFKPVELNHQERQELEVKLKRLKFDLRTSPAPAAVLEPQRYSEAGASREVSFSEREVNALIANNTDLASKLAIDFSPNLVSASVLMPLDPEMPMFGGKTLRLAAGLELYYKNGKPVVVLEGVSLWGVPLPNSWLGNLKNIDLVHEFGDAGFWKAFSDGVADISVGDGTLTLKLKE